MPAYSVVASWSASGFLARPVNDSIRCDRASAPDGRRQPWRAGQRQLGVDDRRVRLQVRTRDPDLHALLLVEDHRDAGDLGARAAGGGHGDDRDARPGDQELAVVVADVAAVREHHRGDLRQVHARTAADADDRADGAAAEALDHVDDVAARQVRLGAVVDRRPKHPLAERVDDLDELDAGRHPRVGDHQDARRR